MPGMCSYIADDISKCKIKLINNHIASFIVSMNEFHHLILVFAFRHSNV